MEVSGPTEAEIVSAANILAKLDPGYLPQQLFNEITRLHVTSTIVIVPFKRVAGNLHALLIKRGDGPNDPVWPGHWHLPGSMLRPSDKPNDYSDAFRRLLDGELAGTRLAFDPIFVRTAFTQTKRGRELTQVYYVELAGAPQTGTLFPVDQLPAPIIEHEPAYIREAAQKLASRA